MHMNAPRWRALVAGAIAALAVDCGSAYSSPTNPGGGGGLGSTSTSISVADNYFSPAATTVPVGSTVTWTWNGARSHNVTFDDGTASGTQATGTFDRTFNTAGTYNYHCTIHGAAMSGSVTVK